MTRLLVPLLAAVVGIQKVPILTITFGKAYLVVIHIKQDVISSHKVCSQNPI
jgi:hypothetical protein